jgi:hypothetical protein
LEDLLVNSHLFSLIRIIGLSGHLVSCGLSSDEIANYRQKAASSAEAIGDNRVTVSFTIPSREQVDNDAGADHDALTGYYYRIQGEGANCPKEDDFEVVGPYEDAKTVKLALTSACSYRITLKVGTYEAAKAALTSKISYTNTIKAVIDSKCLSCHADYASYAGVLAVAPDIVSQVEAGLMPKAGALDQATIAKFVLWGDEGYIESDPNEALISDKEKQITSVFYRNNNNDYVMNYELLGRATYLLRRSLWLQPEGQTAGFTTSKMQTFETQE